MNNNEINKKQYHNEPKINFQALMEQEIKKVLKLDYIPKLLLHSCCAPCAAYILEYLAEYFHLTVYYYNPNITFKEEYDKRYIEQQEFIDHINKTAKYKISFIGGHYDTKEFFTGVQGLEKIREGGARCFKCYDIRMSETARKAKELDFDYFTTALSISPLKNSKKINEIGMRLEEELGVSYLKADFKKKNGYKKSVEIAKDHNLYRQDYCGCVFSKVEREEFVKAKELERKLLEKQELEKLNK